MQNMLKKLTSAALTIAVAFSAWGGCRLVLRPLRTQMTLR